jgi:alpha-beta hydrolase superfamily lysophospholipase
LNAVVDEGVLKPPQSATAEPVYFKSGANRLFGWLHKPATDASSPLGLVICKPFGFEAMSAHLTMRVQAEMAAQLGIPTLRFDYAGTGDSEDLAPAADQLDAWVQDVIAAVQELQRCTCVQRVCLLGIRLGGLIAALAAARCPQVSALIGIAPVVNGKRYLKELRMFELAAAQTQSAYASAAMPKESRDADLAGPDHMEVNGFFLNAPTIAALQRVDVLSLPAASLTAALLIDRQDVPSAAGWRDTLSAAGVNTRYTTLPGFVEMIMRPPNLAVIPQPMLAAVQDWLAQNCAAISASEKLAMRCKSVAPAASPVLELRDEYASQTEFPVLLRTEPALFGIVTTPPAGEVRRRGVILLNSGGDHHIGPRRMYVSLARDWAKHGYVVLRMDLSGLGDSAAQPDRPLNELFPVGAIDDIRVAVQHMRDVLGVRDVTLTGICSGGSHAVRAGMEGVNVDRVLAINPLIFFWEGGSVDLDKVQPWEVVHKPGAYLGRVFSVAAWRRLLFGDVSLWRVIQIYLSRPAMALQSWRRKLARILNMPLKDDLGHELQQLKARGVRVAFMFSAGDAGMPLLQLQSGLSAQELGERYNLRTIDGADHEFTRSYARAALGRALSEELYAARNPR